MTNQRESILRYAAENFGTTPEYLWKSTPDAAVLRHRENGKWYGLLTDIPAEKLGLPSDRTVHILNVKCSPLETGSLLQKAGIFPAYHMNKTHWVTVLLDGTLPDLREAALAKARSRSLETVGRRLQDIYRREGVLPQAPQTVPAVSALNLFSKNSFPGRM